MDPEDLALLDLQVDELKHQVDYEKILIDAEHDIEAKIHAITMMLGMMDIEPTHIHMVGLHRALFDIVEGIQHVLDESKIVGLHIIAEDEETIKEIKGRHREWYAASKRPSEDPIRIKQNELEKLSLLLKNMKKKIEQYPLATVHGDETPDEATAEHYFRKIYHFAKLYEDVFKHLLAKERALKTQP